MNYVPTNSKYISNFTAWEEQKRFVNFTAKDVASLKKLHPLAIKYADMFVEELYQHLMQFSELSRFLSDEKVLHRLKLAQKQYFIDLTSGEYDEEYFKTRVKVGITHHRIGLSLSLYMATYCYYMQLFYPRIYSHPEFSQDTANDMFTALQKIINLDQSVAMTAFISAADEVISRQAEEILEMSTPVVQIWEGVVAAPLIGMMDSSRTQQFMERLLETIVATNSPIALIDITGVPQIDTATAQHLIDTINAVKLLGSQVIITGVRPAIAQTLVHLGIDLSGIITRPTMALGLKVALDKLNINVIDVSKS
ncbi:MAG: protoglobin domain-containing protein [Methylococcaceae bacterium]